jgi:RHS repeat-associated protein
LLPNSTNFGSWNVNSGVTITPSATTAPDGTQTASMVAVGSSGQYYILDNFPCSSGTITYSIWEEEGPNPSATTVLSERAFDSSGNNLYTGFPSIQPTSNWMRYNTSFGAPAGTTSCEVGIEQVALTGGGGSASPGQSVYVWGAQVEQSNSAGPYVATNGVAATGSGGIATLTTSSLSGGSNPITAVYSGDANDAGSTSPVLTQVVPQVPPTITWPTPAAVPFGTALSSTQLDATATVNGTPIPGTFTYKPCVGTVLTTAGANPLSVTFTPADTTDYTTVSDTVSLSVLPPIYDTGTVTLTVDNQTAATTNYGPGSTPATVAAGLAAGANLNSFVNVTAVNDTLYLVAKQAGAGTNYGYSIQDTSNNPTVFTQPSFGSASSGDSLDGGANAGTAQETQPIYSWTAINASTPIYDGVGNVINYSDSVMGNWGFIYDSLNRLEAANPSSGSYNGQFLCWAYDSFGNRTAESLQTTACPAYETSLPATVSYVNSSNQPTNTNQPQSAWGIGAGAGYNFNGIFRYYADGGVKQDPLNHYLYDAEGRLCAVRSAKIGNAMIGYLYDADGIRVAKGSISSMSCDPTINHFVTISDYIIGPANEQLTEMDMDPNQGVMAWQHTNIWAGGTLLGTYDADGTHFYLNDPVGTRRAQTDSQGVLEQTCQSLPYGNGETCAPTPTENLFTGKERDTESGLDYFGARYLSSSMGRFMSPDDGSGWDPSNPQSWNLYSYVLNNPLIFTDPTGRECVWDDGSFDSAGDKQTGSQGGCSSQGGTYVDPQAFSTLNAGDWSNQANTGIAAVASTLSSSSSAITVYANGSQSITTQGMNLDGLVQTPVTSEGYQPAPYALYPQNMHVSFQPEKGYSPWQMLKRMVNCWATDDPNRQIAPKAPEPKASTDTLPNSASNLNVVRGSTRGPQLANSHTAEAMGTAADAAGMANDIANCAGGN